MSYLVHRAARSSRLFAALAALLAATPLTQELPAQATQEPGAGSGIQSVSIPGLPNFSAQEMQQLTETMTELRANGLGFMKGCDYGKYMQLANNLFGGTDAFSSIQEWNKRRELSFPVVDPIAWVMRLGTTEASKQTAQDEARGLAYQLEQVCNNIVQLDEINRQHQLLAAGRVNVRNVINWVGQDAKFTINTAPGTGFDRVSIDVVDTYDAAAPNLGTTSDSTLRLMLQQFREALEFTAEQRVVLDKLSGDFEELSLELYEWAERDTDTGAWACESGAQLDMNAPGMVYHPKSAAPRCGQASPERSMQITPAFMAMLGHMKASEILTNSWLVRVTAASSAAQQYERTSQEAAGLRSMASP